MKKNILLGITASIAAFKACDLIGMLRKKGFEVKCVMTKDAKHFITPMTLETLTCNKVVTDMFELPPARVPVHISLADEADLIAVVPATCDVIGKVASGICDDILTCAIMASNRPIIFAPAMNDKMYLNEIFQEKMKYLKEKGYHFVDPVRGHLACERVGEGHLADLEKIVEKIEKVMSK